MTLHRLKTEREHFAALWDGRKTFEIRWDDRGFEVGDWLILAEWDGTDCTGREVSAKVTHILKGGQFGVSEGWAVLGFWHAWRPYRGKHLHLPSELGSEP